MASHLQKTSLVPRASDPRKFSLESTERFSDAEFARYVSFINTMVSQYEPVGPEEERLARNVAELMFEIDLCFDLQMETMQSAVSKENPEPDLAEVTRRSKLLLKLSSKSDRLLRNLDSDQKKLDRLQMQRRRRELLSRFNIAEN